MIRKNYSSIIIIVLLGIAHQVCSQDQAALARKDSLSRISYRTYCFSPEPYLIDSVLLIPEVCIPKVMKGMEVKEVSSIELPNDSMMFYIKTNKTIILNGKILTSNNPPITISKDNCRRMRVLSEERLLKQFGLLNKNGGIVILFGN